MDEDLDSEFVLNLKCYFFFFFWLSESLVLGTDDTSSAGSLLFIFFWLKGKYLQELEFLGKRILG